MPEFKISRTVYGDQRAVYEVCYTPDIVYAHRNTRDLTLQLLSPVPPDRPGDKGEDLKGAFLATVMKNPPAPHTRPKETRRFPLIVDVPGSGWAGAEGYRHVPWLADLAKQGFVIACIGYRGTFRDDCRFPAAVQDTKEAIRFLRANADMFHIDPDHVCLLGDSSGGHTVAMASLTGNEERFNIGEHLDQPTNVNACVIFYGPNDILNLIPDRLAEGKTLRPVENEYPWPMETWEMFQKDFQEDPERILADASPIRYISADKKLPPFLFINGEEDPIIPLAQGNRFCETVRANGGRAEFVKVAGAGHGTGCWTAEVMELIAQFMKQYN